MIKNLKIPLLLIFLALYQLSISNDYTLEELESLRKINLITNEEYQILRKELEQGGANSETFYSLKMNGKIVSNSFEVIFEGRKKYFSIEDFFEAIKFTNYYKESDEVLIYLGETLEEIRIKDGEIYFKGEKTGGDYPKYLMKDGKIFIESEIFQELFLSYLSENKERLEYSIGLSFTPPVAIDKLLDISLSKLQNSGNGKELIFNGKREIFNLGYARIEAGNSWTRSEEESRYKSDWDGNLSYQGGLLFGEFQFNYDFKEKKFQDFSLDYNNIWKNHTLEISKTDFSSEGEWGFHFYKDRGYYEIGDIIIIRERVPVGSRVELLYMGTPVAIEDEENGEVVFSNNMIRSDRDYQLKIYYPDGKIIMKDIRTSKDYNRQQKGEIEYDITINENAQEDGYTRDMNFYYGLSNNLTIGAGLTRDITKNSDSHKDYMTTASTELTYGDTFNGYSYILQLNGERSFDSYEDESFKDLKDRNQYGYLLEVTKNKWRGKFEQIKYDSYYDEKEENSWELSYDVTNSLRLEYSYDETKFRKSEEGVTKSKEKSSLLGISYDKNIGGVLFGTSVDLDMEDSKNNEYNFNVYYGGFKSLTTRLENSWTNNGEDYEVALEVYNNNLGGFIDVSAEFRYSNIEKETFGLKFSMTLDSWFTVDVDGDEHGNNSVRVGIDKIIDLKNPRAKVDNMDVSRANIITFVDENNNNQYDRGEITVEGVEVSLGTHKVVTDENGRAKLYNLSNGIIYELKPTIKKPSYTMGENIIKIKSNFSSDVDVYIPIKPMINLNGYVNLDESLEIPANEVEEFYSNIIIQILDKDGQEIDLASPDNEGYFDISGLFPEEYIIKVYYIGNDYKILDMSRELKLMFDEENGFDFEIQLNVTDDEIRILDKQELTQAKRETFAYSK